MPLPNATGSNNFIRQPNVEDDDERYLVRVDLPARPTTTSSSATSTATASASCPGWFGGVLDGTLDVGVGPQLPQLARAVAGWTKVLGASLVNESRFS